MCGASFSVSHVCTSVFKKACVCVIAQGGGQSAQAFVCAVLPLVCPMYVCLCLKRHAYVLLRSCVAFECENKACF